MRAIPLTLVLALALPGVATAQDRTFHRMGHKRLSQTLRRSFPQPTFVAPDGRPVPTYQQWASKSYMPLAQGRITVQVDPSIGARMAASPGAIRLGSGIPAPAERLAFLHEMGHQLDYSKGGDQQAGQPTALRQGFQKLIGDNRPWWAGQESRAESFGGTDARGLKPPGERFADDYGQLARYGLDATIKRNYSGEIEEPTFKPDQWRSLYNLVMRTTGYPQSLSRAVRARHRR